MKSNKNRKEKANISNLIQIKTTSLETKRCQLAYINPWSINNKTTAIYDFIETNKIDLLAVTESWMKTKEEGSVEYIFEHEMLPKSHQMVLVPRSNAKRGGGIAVIYKKEIKLKVMQFTGKLYKQFEYAVCSVNINKTLIKLIIVYRPVPTKVNTLNVRLFWKEFEKFLSKHAFCKEDILITGDLNFHLDETSHPDTIRLNMLLEEFDLLQRIQEPTHKAGHTLDVLITRTDFTKLCTVCIRPWAL